MKHKICTIVETIHSQRDYHVYVGSPQNVKNALAKEIADQTGLIKLEALEELDRDYRFIQATLHI